MNNLLKDRKKRMKKKNSNEKELDIRLYNFLLGVFILYGLGLNYLLCAYNLDFFTSINPLIMFTCYIVLELTGIFITCFFDDPLISFIGYNLVVIPFGIFLSIILKLYGGIDYIVKESFYYTTIITTIMVIMGVLFPKFFKKVGSFLLSSLLIIVFSSIMIIFNSDNNIYKFFTSPWFISIIFSLYIGYDIFNAQRIKHTVNNAIDSALSIYLDITEVFITIFKILSKKKK